MSTAIIPIATVPCIKYPGGKRGVVTELYPYWEAHKSRRLVELFVGSASVALGLQPESALLNDNSAIIINLHQQLQQGLSPDPSWVYDRTYYLDRRNRLNELIQSNQIEGPEAAQIVVFLSKTGFNGLFRTSARTGFNVPFGQHKNVKFPTDFSPWQRAYKNWVFTCQDFEAVELTESDFVYSDPPYVGEDTTEPEFIQESLFLETSAPRNLKRGFTQYSEKGFTWNDQVRLAKRLAQHPGPCLISNAFNPWIIRLYESLNFTIKIIEVQRSIDCKGKRPKAKEILASRNC
ncbi:DNA adenine methylase [Leptolyngbya sp. AN03gr2]|uniref:DNA adenine methylase n=1 Tax=unclassified Leptolyngbya TaxID=2650499 RepID=UPI003D30FEA1